jgi:hypothetical protein
VTAFGADERCDPAAGHDPLDVRGGQGQLERPGVRRCQLADQVNLLERGGHGCLARQLSRHVHGPELTAHTAGCEPGQVSVREAHRSADVGGCRVA